MRRKIIETKETKSFLQQEGELLDIRFNKQLFLKINQNVKY